ncbi:hypothetical protein [Actinophytocola xanthii]|uniref:Uncharacterized protein n=1 Tax=Actinophytocola xanthii TaxID=1912961 RepID=A0A1Q8BY90_9PSEU|nr:hypothetical protein [Actinophytocola xanthii]OLF07055.1 hypothetical protein BU204_35865 [Actinophytocola xanthii]
MRALTLVLAAVAAVLLPVPTAAATTASAARTDFPPCWFAPSPGSGWTMTNHRFFSCEECEAAGAAGVANGRWPAYRCAWVPIGLDIEYFVFVPTATPA